MEGKKEFYKKVEEALKSKGYEYYDGDRDISGKGRRHANKPDYIAVKNGKVYIGEIKSPAEGPKSGSWRQIQNSDTEEFMAVRMDVAKREKAGLVLPEIGGHEIIIDGQIADYVRKIGINFELHIVQSFSGEYIISIPQKGAYIKSDLEIEYQLELSTVERRVYLLKGELNIISGDVTNG